MHKREEEWVVFLGGDGEGREDAKRAALVWFYLSCVSLTCGFGLERQKRFRLLRVVALSSAGWV